MSEFTGTVTTPGGEEEVSGSFALAPILMGLKQLKMYRERVPPERRDALEWDIKLYEWILAQPDAEDKAMDYARVRKRPPLPKKEVVEILGWDIDKK